MEEVRNLINQGYAIFNIDETKAPVNKSGNKMNNWINLSNEELIKQHNYKSKLWGMKMGKQENGKYILSLDFDVCGKKDKEGNRVGCEETKKKLQEYEDGVDNLDGMFSSSTKGNKNVLVDYTKSPKIIEYVKELNSNKFTFHELEILVGGNQVIPPSQTICKISQKLGSPRKFQTENIFYIIESEDGFVYDFIINLFKTKLNKSKVIAKNVVKPPNNIIKNDNVMTTNDEVDYKDDIYLQLLFNVIKNERDDKGYKIISHQYWFQICGILKYNSYSKTIWLNYSNSISQTKTASKTWDAIKNNTPMSIYGLQNIAKEVNPFGYKEWFYKHKQYISLKVLDKGENDIAKCISEQLKETLVYCDDKWFVFDKKTRLWRVVKNPSATITNHIQARIDQSKETLFFKINQTENEDDKKKLKDYEKQYNKHYREVNNSSFASQIIKLLTEYLFDGDFSRKLDNIPYQIAYKNGVLDLKTLKFRNGIQQFDFLTTTIPYDYEIADKNDIDYVRKEIKKICNNNEEHLNYYLSVLGYCLTGDSSLLQEFYCIRGQKASNGKSVIFEALINIIPNYIVKLESSFLEENYGSRHKEIATWKGVRIAWVNELSNKKQDSEALKQFADGTSERYKVMYGNMDTMKINFKIMITTNNTLNINADNGIARRMRIQQMDSEFLNIPIEQENYEKCIFKKDENFGNLLQNKYKHALMALIYSYSKDFVDYGNKLKPYPKEWQEESNDVVSDNNKFKEFFDNYFEIDSDGLTSKFEFENLIKSNLRGNFNIKDELKKMKIKFTYNSHMRKDGKRGFYSGFKLIERDDETISEELSSLDS